MISPDEIQHVYLCLDNHHHRPVARKMLVGGLSPNRDDPKYVTCHNIKKRHKGTVSKPVKIARTTVFGGRGRGSSHPSPPSPAGYGPASRVFSAVDQSLGSKCPELLTESSSQSERASFPKIFNHSG